MSSSERQQKVRCDICTTRDGFKGMRLFTCITCNVHVHKECYGIGPINLEDFKCWACLAVGKSFQVEDKFPDGSRRRIFQTRRPTRCELCSVHDGVHAMHPLYDYHGPGGRQIMCTKSMEGNKDEEPRLAWVHSLCAYFIAGKEGLVYGCGYDGFYVGDNETSTDDRSVNSAVLADDEDEEDDSVHHFAYNLRRPGEEPNAWIQAIERHQAQDHCIICGLDDRPKGVLRIAMPCSANCDDEYSVFKRMHKEMDPDEVCMVSSHIGCAQWGKPGSIPVRRVYFYPGVNDEKAEYTEPTLESYCDAHAAEIAQVPMDSSQKVVRVQKHVKRTLARVGRPVVTESRKKLQKRINTGLPNSPRNMHNTVSMRSNAQSAARMPNLPSPKQPRLTNAPSSSRPTIKRMSMTELGPLQRGRFSRKRQMTAAMDKGIATAVTTFDRPLLARKRSDIANASHTPTKSKLEQMQEDAACDTITAIMDLELTTGGDIALRKQLMKSRRKYWFRQFNDIPSEEFNALWKNVKSEVRDALTGGTKEASHSQQKQESPPPSNSKQKSSEVIELLSDGDNDEPVQTKKATKYSSDDIMLDSSDEELDATKAATTDVANADSDPDSLFDNSDDNGKKKKKGAATGRIDDNSIDSLFDSDGDKKAPSKGKTAGGDKPSSSSNEDTTGKKKQTPSSMKIGDDDDGASYDELFDDERSIISKPTETCAGAASEKKGLTNSFTNEANEYDDGSYDELFDDVRPTSAGTTEPVTAKPAANPIISHDDVSSSSSGVDDDWTYNNVDDDRPALKPSRWSQYTIGKYFTGKKFSIGEWDSMEQLSMPKFPAE